MIPCSLGDKNSDEKFVWAHSFLGWNKRRPGWNRYVAHSYADLRYAVFVPPVEQEFHLALTVGEGLKNIENRETTETANMASKLC